MTDITLTTAATDRIRTAFWTCGFFAACLTFWSWQSSAAQLPAVQSPAVQSSPLTQQDSDMNRPQPTVAAVSAKTVSPKRASTETASVGNYVWEDTNVDGIQGFLPAENPIPGVVVSLYHASGLLADMTTTDSNGFYLFQFLAPGEYYLAFTTPDGMVATKRYQGGDPNKDSDIDLITGLTSIFTLEAGANDQSFDAGFTHAASISSWIWHDQNQDSIKNFDEPGVPATVVTLYDELGQVVQITPSDVNGYFTFPVITPGVYTLGVTPPPRMTFTTRGITRSDAFHSDVDPLTGHTDLFQVYVGPNNFNWGAGLVAKLAPTALSAAAEPAQQIDFSVQSFLPLIHTKH